MAIIKSGHEVTSDSSESANWGFCDTCKFFVRNKSVTLDVRGICHEPPTPVTINQASMHWCSKHQTGMQRVPTSSSVHPEGTGQIIDGKTISADQTTLNESNTKTGVKA